MKIELTILGQCVSSKNRREIFTHGDKPMLVKSEEARNYERSAGLQIPASARQMLEGPLRVTMRIYYASERSDLDGELLCDIMAAKYKRFKGKLTLVRPGEYSYGPSERKLIARGVYENDRQIKEKHYFHAIDKFNPRVEVVIETMQPQQAQLLEGATT